MTPCMRSESPRSLKMTFIVLLIFQTGLLSKPARATQDRDMNSELTPSEQLITGFIKDVESLSASLAELHYDGDNAGRTIVEDSEAVEQVCGKARLTSRIVKINGTTIIEGHYCFFETSNTTSTDECLIQVFHREGAWYEAAGVCLRNRDHVLMNYTLPIYH